MEYVRNTWYPLTWSRDVGRALIKRRIVGEDVVLYRAESGGVVAMLDMCPHRMLPLSMGRLRGDAIECGYHGMTFNENGRCVRIPGQDRVGPKIGVKTFPVTERMGLVWIWLGAPELADPAKVFNLPEYDDPNWCFAHGDALAIGTNYLNLADNLCDPSHVSFVHQSTLGNASSQDVPVESRDIDSGVLVWRWIRNAPAIPLFAEVRKFHRHGRSLALLLLLRAQHRGDRFRDCTDGRHRRRKRPHQGHADIRLPHDYAGRRT